MSRASSVIALSLLSSVASLAIGAACTPAVAPVATEDPSTKTDRRTQTSEPSFVDLEQPVLARLSVADARIAKRSTIVPQDSDLNAAAMTIIGGKNETATLMDGSVDPFSFDAREAVASVGEGSRGEAARIEGPTH